MWAPLRANRYYSFNLSHSICGEDMMLRYIFHGQKTGSFIDLGAYHPTELSNTYYFYSIGWTGLNIDVRPSVVPLFHAIRPRDVTVVGAISDRSGEPVEVFEFDPEALTTLSPAEAERVGQMPDVRLVRRTKIQTKTLTEILDKHWTHKSIDLLSIDVEGLDEAIIMSFDWDRFRPRVVCFEQNQVTAASLFDTPAVKRLAESGYSVRAFSGPSIIMVRT